LGLKFFQLQSINKTNDTLREGSNLLLNILKDLPQLFLQGNKIEKKKVLNLIGSNYVYKDKELSIVLNPVFNYLLNFDFSEKMGVKRQCSNFLHCIKTLVNTTKDAKFQLLMENLSVLYYNQAAA